MKLKTIALALAVAAAGATGSAAFAQSTIVVPGGTVVHRVHHPRLHRTVVVRRHVVPMRRVVVVRHPVHRFHRTRFVTTRHGTIVRHYG